MAKVTHLRELNEKEQKGGSLMRKVKALIARLDKVEGRLAFLENLVLIKQEEKDALQGEVQEEKKKKKA